MEDIKIGTEADSIQYIVIKVGEEQYGIDIAYVDNIVRMQNITRVPKVAPFLKGVINLRGIVIPVMSLRVKMGLEDDVITKNTRIIILKLESQGTMGVIVDEVKEVITISNEQLEKVATNNTSADKTNFVSSVGKCGEELVSILDLNSLAIDKE